MKTCDQMGREAFREDFGFDKSRQYFVRHAGRTYDSKPLIAVAYGYQYDTDPLENWHFSGGADTVRPAFERLGFQIVDEDFEDDPAEFASEMLAIGDVYTREELRELFEVEDATINNGIIRVKRWRSIWLFVTKDKTADRPQLVDRLDGDTLHWSGQPSGRTDKLIINHLDAGDEVLLFYRDRRDRYPGGGFRYEGPFLYRSHSGAKPAAFVLERDATAEMDAEAADDGEGYDPKNTADGRQKVLVQINRRRGQTKFRRSLMNAYEGRCAVTGCGIHELLEAAHIQPYKGEHTNHVTNGLLLRADIHTMFDLGLIGVREDHSLDICPTLAKSEYGQFTALRLPRSKASRPNSDALAWHLENVASPAARARLIEKREVCVYSISNR